MKKVIEVKILRMGTEEGCSDIMNAVKEYEKDSCKIINYSEREGYLTVRFPQKEKRAAKKFALVVNGLGYETQWADTIKPTLPPMGEIKDKEGFREIMGKVKLRTKKEIVQRFVEFGDFSRYQAASTLIRELFLKKVDKIEDLPEESLRHWPTYYGTTKLVSIEDIKADIEEIEDQYPPEMLVQMKQSEFDEAQGIVNALGFVLGVVDDVQWYDREKFDADLYKKP